MPKAKRKTVRLARRASASRLKKHSRKVIRRRPGGGVRSPDVKGSGFRPKRREKPKRQPRRKRSSRSRPRRIIRKIARKRKISTGKKEYRANQNFELFEELRKLLIKASPSAFPKLVEDLRKIGKIKLVIVTGIFFNIQDSRIDLLVVGDNISLPRFINVIKNTEAEVGKELRYVILGQDEFLYRYEMFDRFLRDIIDGPHQKIVNRLRFTL